MTASHARTAILGCGSQKRDLSDETDPVPICQLYTSTYFELKREYAQTHCDDYRILSAKHGLVRPDYPLTDGYDLTITDLTEAERAEWVSDVESELRQIADSRPADTLVMLAGQRYLTPFEEILHSLPTEIAYPFEHTTGIGDQMGWLKSAIESPETDTPSEQSTDGHPTLDQFTDNR